MAVNNPTSGQTAGKKPAGKKPAAKKPAMRIHAKRPHRRAGYDFGTDPVTILKSDLKKEQIEQIVQDHELVVEAVQV